jgi:hypothetical protein
VTRLLIEVEGATEEELQRGLAAAQAMFDDADVLVLEAAAAAFKRGGEQEDISEREARFATRAARCRPWLWSSRCGWRIKRPDELYVPLFR